MRALSLLRDVGFGYGYWLRIARVQRGAQGVRFSYSAGKADENLMYLQRYLPLLSRRARLEVGANIRRSVEISEARARRLSALREVAA